MSTWFPHFGVLVLRVPPDTRWGFAAYLHQDTQLNGAEILASRILEDRRLGLRANC
jgi:hypothetical protein